MSDWYLVRTKPRQERRALENIENQAFNVYCPWYIRKSIRPEPLFPGYLFLRARDPSSAFYSKVSSTRGILNFVRFGKMLATVPDSVIESLKLQEEALADDWKCKPGQLVELCEGPFRDLQGVYLCEKGIDRCVILLNVINRQQKVVVDCSHIRAIV